jgi:dihydrolipoamide dehydrogenase
MARPFDLIVIGAGAGGEVAAYLNARAGKRVAIIEAEKAGGECPNYGCVPTKSLLHAADIYRSAKASDRFGVHADLKLDYHKLKAWKDTAVRRTGTDHAEEMYKAEGIQSIKGHAQFVSPWAVSVNGQEYGARNFLIATGSSTFIPPIGGLADAGYITFREAIDLTALPKSMFIIGGGAIGCEFAELFSTFGSKVSIADITPRLAMAEDADVGQFIGNAFKAKGVEVHTGTKVEHVIRSGKRKIVTFEQDGHLHHKTVDVVMVASGKTPNTNLGLENAGVRYNRGGIITNRYMQTSVKHIFAAGDVVGPYRFTHTASYQSRVAAFNILHPRQKRKVDYSAIPRCIFISPEVASVGPTEQQLTERLIKYRSATVPIGLIGRANTSDVSEGFVKVLADPRGRILGGSIVSPRAGEMIQELTIAVQHRLTVTDIAETIHAYPTWTEAVRLACQKLK